MNEQLEKEIEDTALAHKEKFKALYDEHFSDPLDEDGYPTDGTLELIAHWFWEDPKGWFDFIESIWYLRSWGWHSGEARSEGISDKQVIRYDISTAGWSGNEDIIAAMRKNWLLWHDTWYSSRRGGHYVFELDKE